MVAADLDRDYKGKVTIGTDTKIACDAALRHYSVNPCHDTIMVAAGNASKRFDRVWMADLMEKYILGKRPSTVTLKAKAKTFNTMGEMECLARAARERDPDRILIVTKWWHMDRVLVLCEYWLREYCVGHLKREAIRCDSDPSLLTVFKERCLAMPLNRFRMWRRDVFDREQTV